MDEQREENWLTTRDVIHRIREALESKQPLSVVRVGDGENLCLAQSKVWPIRRVLSTRWAKLSRTTNWKGVRLPNLLLRDQLIRSIKKADIVGIPYENDTEILAKAKHLRPLTDRCFRKYGIRPKQLCHTFVNRHMVEYEEFWEMLRGKRVVVISRWARQFKNLVRKKYDELDINFVKLIRIDRFADISRVMDKCKSVECDIVFISAGVNAVILAQRLAEEQGRIAIDFGKSAVFMVSGNRKVRPWKPERQEAHISKQTVAARAVTPAARDNAERGREHLKVTVIGSGYVGTTTALVLAGLGHEVIGYDVDGGKVKQLNAGKLTFVEPGLDRLLDEQLRSGRISFTSDGRAAVANSDILMISVGTPSDHNGQANLTYLNQVLDTIAKYVNGPKIVVTKSTVPIGTNRWMQEKLASLIDMEKHPVDVVSNPEFLREGSALHDSLHPSRTVIGGEKQAAIHQVKAMYANLETTFFVCNYETAELIKYASNGFLAAKISFINEMARLADRVGADIDAVAKGMGMDTRISPHHLRAGLGYGGSCFPKDVDELLYFARKSNIPLSLMEQTKRVNESQIAWFTDKMQAVIPMEGRRVLVLGAAFKEDTDDQRESPGIRLIERLLALGAEEVRVMDPTVQRAGQLRFTEAMKPELLDRVQVVTDPLGAAAGVDAVVLATPWSQFADCPWQAWAKTAASPYLFDGRNFLNPDEMRSFGWQYFGVARGGAR